MAGIMKSGKDEYPFILIELKGNPHIVIFVNGMAIRWVTPNPLT